MPQLESLPNEVLLQMFNFLRDAELFRAFFGLNDRLNALLFSSRPRYHLDFQSISLRSVASFFEQHMSVITDRIVSIQLSNADETPGLIEHFLRRCVSLNSFINLRSLTFKHLSSYECLRDVFEECHTVPHLTGLHFEQCLMELDINQYKSISEEIYQLPHLARCHLGIGGAQKLDAVPLNRSLPSLERLCIDFAEVDIDTLKTIAANAPHLQHLDIRVGRRFPQGRLDCRLERLVSFTLYTRDYFDTDSDIWQWMPNLQHLKVESFSAFFHTLLRWHFGYNKCPRMDDRNNLFAIHNSGQQWETVIRRFLPKLDSFQLKMQYHFWVSGMERAQADDLLSSFNTSFWTHEHRWFVRCEWNTDSSSPYFCLYTLPCTFTQYSTQHPVLMSKSTSPTEFDYCRPELQLQHPVSFCNVHDLSIVLPAPSVANDTLATLDRLQSLSVFLRDGNDETLEQLQNLIDRSPSLYALKISCGKLTDAAMGLLRINSRTVRLLDLENYTEHEGWCWFTAEQCKALRQSPLAERCEVLRMNVDTPSDAVDLVYAMSSLRALNVRIRTDPYWEWERRPSTNEDDVLNFFREFFDPTCTVMRNPLDFHQIQLWIR